jgi:hypothetical protein
MGIRLNNTEIELNLGQGCCIECAAKHEYNKCVARIMTSDATPGPDEESKMELLLDFLETADFAALRASDEGLAGIKDSRCLLKIGDDGKPYVTVVKH